MPDKQNNDIIENPYYEAITNEKLDKVSSKRTEAVDLDNIDIVTATTNIYYA